MPRYRVGSFGIPVNRPFFATTIGWHVFLRLTSVGGHRPRCPNACPQRASVAPPPQQNTSCKSAAVTSPTQLCPTSTRSRVTKPRQHLNSCLCRRVADKVSLNLSFLVVMDIDLRKLCLSITALAILRSSAGSGNGPNACGLFSFALRARFKQINSVSVLVS